MDVGEDNVTTVDSGYTVPNAFTGTIAKVTFHTGAMKISQAQRRHAASAQEAYFASDGTLIAKVGAFEVNDPVIAKTVQALPFYSVLP